MFAAPESLEAVDESEGGSDVTVHDDQFVTPFCSRVSTEPALVARLLGPGPSDVIRANG